MGVVSWKQKTMGLSSPRVQQWQNQGEVWEDTSCDGLRCLLTLRAWQIMPRGFTLNHCPLAS